MIGGRLFGTTIFGRYDYTDPVNNPIMALEYIKRNQNWSDNSGTALIKISGDGSFDDTGLAEIKALTIARQIENEEQQWSDTLTKSLCEAFYLVSRQNSDGYECVHYLLNSETPATTISIGMIVPGSIGMVEPPRAENIIVEPYIKYAYDYASGEFTQSLRIEGVADNSVWSSSLTPGFTGNDGESLWNKCRVNYLKYGRNEKVPSSISDQYWIPNYATALWKITKMLEWQEKSRFSFSVFYSTGRFLYCGEQIYIQFVNETNNISLRAVINKIVKNKNRNKVDIGVTILDDIPSSFYYTAYQVTDNALTEWQATDGATEEYQEAG
jgi:hypothetical protein